MTLERRAHPLSEPTRELRRLEESTPVMTAYQDHRDPPTSRVADGAEERRGYEDGYTRGLADAQAQVERSRRDDEQRVARATSLLALATAELVETRERLRVQFEARLPEFVVALVAEIVGHEISACNNPGRDALARALRMCDEAAVARVRMNPGDLEVLGEVSDVAGTRQITFVADDTVRSGGVLVEMGSTTLDGRIDAALERVRAILTGAGRTGVGDDRAA